MVLLNKMLFSNNHNYNYNTQTSNNSANISRAPIYGGKVMKTSIVNNCNCPIVSDNNAILYANSSIQNQIYDVTYKYSVFDFVFAKKLGDSSS